MLHGSAGATTGILFSKIGPDYTKYRHANISQAATGCFRNKNLDRARLLVHVIVATALWILTKVVTRLLVHKVQPYAYPFVASRWF